MKPASDRAPFGRLADLCDVRGWEVSMRLGKPRPDLREKKGDFLPHDLVLEISADGRPTMAEAVRFEEPGLDRGAMELLNRIAERSARA